MTKLGVRVGWTPPPAFQLSDDFLQKLETERSVRFSAAGVGKLADCCYRLMETWCKLDHDAQAVRTRNILGHWFALYAELESGIREPLACPEIAAAWMAIARISDAQKVMKLPDPNRHLAEIEAMRFLTERAHKKVAAAISSGPEGNKPVRRWISDVAAVFESEGIPVTTTTRRGSRTSPKFTAVLELLRNEMSLSKFVRVRLPSTKQLVELSREVFNSRCHGQ